MTPVNSSIASAPKAIPSVTRRRAPKRGTRRVWPSAPVGMITAIIGRNARPVVSGEKPSVCLHVIGQEEEDAEHPGADDRDGEERAAAGAVAHDAQRQQRVRDAALDRDEGDQQRDAGGQRGDRQRRAPAVRLGAREAVHEREQAARGGERAGHVEPRPRRGGRSPGRAAAARRSARGSPGTG